MEESLCLYFILLPLLSVELSYVPMRVFFCITAKCVYEVSNKIQLRKCNNWNLPANKNDFKLS